MAAIQLKQEIHTGKITVMSNLMSVSVEGKKVSRLGPKTADTATVHVNFEVKHPHRLSAELEPTEELELILSPADAVELGRALLAMGLAHESAADVNAAIAQLTETTQQLNSGS